MLHNMMIAALFVVGCAFLVSCGEYEPPVAAPVCVNTGDDQFTARGYQMAGTQSQWVIWYRDERGVLIKELRVPVDLLTPGAC